MMFFIWDEHKNQSNIAKHGVGFEEAKALFYAEDSLHFKVKNINGEQRLAVIGNLDEEEKVFICIYVQRKNAFRIISVRIAHENEKKLWQKK